MSNEPEARPLRVFVNDYPEYWAAYDKDDLRALVIETCGEDSWDPDYFDELADDKTVEMLVTSTGELADEDDAKIGNASPVTMTWAEFAKKNGRGYLGGAE